MTSLRKSFAFSFAQKYATIVIWTVTAMIVARLLTPEEIGVFSVSVAIVHIAHMLRDFGIQGYLIQERELTPARIRTAFTLTLACSWTMAAALVLLSGPFAEFYDEPGTRKLLLVLALTFVIIPFNSSVLALMRRDLEFGKISAIVVMTAVIQASTTVVFAANGYSYMSYAWASLAGTTTTAVLAGFFRPSAMRIWVGLAEWRRVTRSGLRISAATFVSELGTSAGDLILGRIQGFAAVGIYGKAVGLMHLFHLEVMGVINFVAVPAMAARDREGANLRKPALHGIALVTVLGWPFYVFLAAMAFPILRVMFGDQWDAAAPLTRILALAGAIGLFWPLGFQVIFALGRLDMLLKAMTTITVARVALLAVCAFIDLEAVAWATVGAFAISFLVYLLCLHRLIALRFVDIVRASWRSALVAAASGVGPLAVLVLFDVGPGNVLVPLLVAGVTAGLGWLGGVFAFAHPVRDEVRIVLKNIAVFAQERRAGPRPGGAAEP